MSEEITNASTAVPTSIMLSVLINGSFGFGMLLAMLFCLGDIGTALESPTGYPFMSIFLQATGSVSGTAVMCSIVTTMGITTSVGMLASASRQLWSFARDRGIPGWRLWSRVCLEHHRVIEQINAHPFIHTGSWRYSHSNLLGPPDHLRSLSSGPHSHRVLSCL